MLFWIAVAALSAAVTFAVTRPLLKETIQDAPAGAADLAVYKDQLSEIDTDRARGLISEVEAEAAKAEVGRRLLRKADQSEGGVASLKLGAVPKWVHFAATLILPVASLGLYIAYGAPGLPGAPLKERLAAPINGTKTQDLIAKVEQRLRAHPEDGRGWDVIAPVYMAGRRFSDAADAYAKANRILGETPKRLLGFAEARIRSEDDVIPDDARAALQSVLKIEPKNFEARIWLALAKEEDGDKAAATAAFKALLADAPADAPWKGPIAARLAALENPAPASGLASGQGSPAKAAAAPAATPSGPSQRDMSAAEQMTPQARQAMIDGMVGRLAERLKTNARDKDGWQRLIRAYQVLGRKDDAVKAVASAKAGLAGDNKAIEEIEAFAKSIGVGG